MSGESLPTLRLTNARENAADPVRLAPRIPSQSLSGAVRMKRASVLAVPAVGGLGSRSILVCHEGKCIPEVATYSPRAGQRLTGFLPVS